MSDSYWVPEAQLHGAGKDRPQNAPEAPAALAVSADDFAAIEDRITAPWNW